MLQKKGYYDQNLSRETETRCKFFLLKIIDIFSLIYWLFFYTDLNFFNFILCYTRSDLWERFPARHIFAGQFFQGISNRYIRKLRFQGILRDFYDRASLQY